MKRYFRLTKRQKFVVSSLALGIGAFLVQNTEVDYRYFAIAGLSLIAGFMSAWALKDGLGKSATLLTLVLPVFFTAGTELFYLGFESSSFYLSVLPVLQTVIKVFSLLAYVVCIYALLLTGNIYNVATARTIQLLRAAHAVGFVLSLVVLFFLFNWLLSLRLDFWLNAAGMGALSLPVFLQGFWSIELEHKLGEEVLLMSVALGLVIAEFGALLSFWPITVPVGSLALTSVVYIGLGLGQAKLQQRLFEKTVREYLAVGVLVFAAMFLTARWGG